MELLYSIKEFREKELAKIEVKLDNEKLRGSTKQKQYFKKSQLEEFCNVFYNSCKLVTDYFDLSEMSIFEKTRKRQIRLSRQISHYLIMDKNEKNIRYYLSWTARLFNINHATVKHSVKIVSNEKNFPTSEGKEILDALDFISKGKYKVYFLNDGKEKSNIFFADSYKICKKIAEHLKVPLKETFKPGSLENKLCIYEIVEKNRETFNEECWALMSGLFSQRDSSIKEAYDKISETNISTPEGRKIVEVLNLF